MTLNRAQRIIVRIGGCMVLFELLFPPVIGYYGYGYRYLIFFEERRYFIFAPPPLWRVNVTLLFFQIAAIVTGTALLAWWFHSHQQASAQSPSERASERSILQQFRSLMGPLRRGRMMFFPGGIFFFLLLVLLLFFIAMYRSP